MSRDGSVRRPARRLTAAGVEVLEETVAEAPSAVTVMLPSAPVVTEAPVATAWTSAVGVAVSAVVTSPTLA